ncbi:MAG: FtsX-like permease family protein [Crocinitomicaceae bacterium]|nr:FtsX-like permease family protein [Crocinitomicaceae bacterium]
MIVKLAWKNIWRNRRRTFITISAIAFAVLFAVGMRSMQQGMEEQMLESIVNNNMGYIQIHNNGFWDEQTLDNGFYADEIPIDEIEALSEIVAVDKKLETGTLSSNGNISRGTFVMSYDQTKELPTKITNNITEGTFPEAGKGEILMGEELAEYINVEIGDTIIFLGQGYQGATAAGLYTLSGTIDLHVPDLNKIIAYMTMEDLQEFISAPELLSALLIEVKHPDRIDETIKDLESIVGDGFEVMAWYDMNPELKQTLDTSAAKGWIMNFILYMIITFVMFGTILMATQERRYELGVLLAIGMKKWRSMVMVVIENIIINIIGVIVGIAIMTPISYHFHSNPIVIQGEQAELMESMGFEAVIPFSIDPTIALNHASIVLVISILLLLYPILSIRKMKPVEAMKL